MLNYCCEPVDRIEGYIPEEKRTVKMVIHHRLESHDENGTLRTRFLSMQQLKDAGLYYNRPASELIWMTESAHKSLHQKDLSYKENLQKMSEKNIGRKVSDVQKNKLMVGERVKLLNSQSGLTKKNMMIFLMRYLNLIKAIGI